MDPRGIVAALTAATFSGPLIHVHIEGASKLLPATFLVIMLTVLVYGLSAAPVVRSLGLREDTDDTGTAHDQVDPTPSRQGSDRATP
jgi:NhaP-type Na+/H+ or K+/H+ antiporter